MTIISLLLTFFSMITANNKIDFPIMDDASRWTVINDGVMGGRSQAAVEDQGTSILFSGTLSLANNGGFSSYRSPWQQLDLSNMEGIEIRVKGDGRSYGFSLDSNKRWYMPNHKTTFDTKAGEWMTIQVPLKQFDLLRIGEVVRTGSERKEFSKIQRMGFILSDKKPGAFSLEIDYVDFY